MADPAPRTRSAATIADDAAMLLAEVQTLAVAARDVEPSNLWHVNDRVARLAGMVERLVAQVEDLAAASAPEPSDDHRCEDCGDTRSPDDHRCPNDDCPSHG